MPASPISSSASNSNGSPVAPYASQAFPLSSPRPYASPPLKSHDDIGSLHDESSDEDDELQELMNKLKSSRNHTGPFISPIKPQVEGPPSPNIATGPSMTSAAVIGRMKPQSKLTGKDKYEAAPPQTSNGDLSSNQPCSSKGKRKAESFSTPTSCETSGLAAKRPKSNHFQPRIHEEFYRLDGNVIVEIDQSTRFKLHRSRLVNESKYFAKLFEPKDGNVDDLEMVNNHPLYTISGVRVEDFTALLRAMDDAIIYYYNRPSFDTVASILRASTTLSFPRFRDWAVRYLEEMWSDDLTDLSPDRLNNAVETIILGRNYGIPTILKRAFYELLRTDGLGHHDINDDQVKSNEDDILSINPDDTYLLICTRVKLEKAWSDTLASAFHTFHCPNGSNNEAVIGQDANGTANTVTCPSNVEKTTEWAKLVYASGLSQEYMYDVLCGLKVLVDRDWRTEDGYCEECTNMRRDAWQNERVKLWEKLDLWLKI